MREYFYSSHSTLKLILCSSRVSAYMPQLSAKVHLSSTNANFVMASGNAGVYLSGPFVGILVDRRGPRMMLSFAGFVLLFGYLGIKMLYDGGREGLYSRMGIWGLALCQLMTGIGGSAALASAVKAVSQSFSKARRGAAMATVLSCFGLSAFFCTFTCGFFCVDAKY